MKDLKDHADHTSPDVDADKSGTDTSADSTEKRKGQNEFDKPTREVDPDRTGIDIDSDKTTDENNAK